jgi:glucose-6-phosphate 1-epimerase
MDKLSHIDDLNRRFGIAGVARVISGNGGLTKIRVTTHAAAAEIYLQGSQVMSWKPDGAEEVIFVSEKSLWENGQAIRGGVPICFPWFRAKADNPQAPKHGFVRMREWQLNSIAAEEDGPVTVNCSTQSDDSTLRWWPHEFCLEHRVTVDSTLTMELIVTNIGPSPLRFEEALHTYFRVGTVQGVRVRGLDKVAYLDNNDNNREKLQSGDVMIVSPTDYAFINSNSALELMDSAFERTIRTEKKNSNTTVVWNPWQQGAAAMADFGDDEWQHMTCVEASNILGNAVTLQPGEQHAMRATLSMAKNEH